MALSISSFPPSPLSLFDSGNGLPGSISNIAVPKQSSWFSPQLLHSLLVSPMLKWLHYLFSLFGPKLRDDPLFFSIVTTSNPLASSFDSNFKSFPDNKHVWELSHQTGQVTLISHVVIAADFYPMLTCILPIDSLTETRILYQRKNQIMLVSCSKTSMTSHNLSRQKDVQTLYHTLFKTPHDLAIACLSDLIL